MFKTSQPNPENPGKERIKNETRDALPVFESRADFSKWIDEQLLKLESSQKEFLTLQSKRVFFDRN